MQACHGTMPSAWLKIEVVCALDEAASRRPKALLNGGFFAVEQPVNPPGTGTGTGTVVFGRACERPADGDHLACARRQALGYSASADAAEAPPDQTDRRAVRPRHALNVTGQNGEPLVNLALANGVPAAPAIEWREGITRCGIPTGKDGVYLLSETPIV